MDHIVKLAADASGYGGEIDLRNNTFLMRAPDGRVVKMDIGQSNVHIDTALANFCTGYQHAEYMADVAMPIVPVQKASDYFYEFNPDNALAPVQGTQVGPGGTVIEVNPQFSSTRYNTLQYALGGFLATEVIANQDAVLNLQMRLARQCMDILLLNREIRVETVMFTSASYTGTHLRDLSGSPSTLKWNGGTASDPVSDINGIQEAALLPITDMLMALPTWNAFTRNPAVQKYTGYKQAVQGIPTMDQVQAFCSFLNLPRIHIAQGKAKDTTGAYPYIWASDVVLFHRPAVDLPVDGLDTCTAKTFRWNGGENMPDVAVPIGVNGAQIPGGFAVRAFYNPYRGPRGGYQVVVTHNDAEQFITQLVSGLIKGAYA